jgi:Zn ribbon nucleic-acid-binding protein
MSYSSKEISVKCPNCNSTDIGDRWVADRKLQRYCRDCNWHEKSRIPEKLRIQTTRFVEANQFPGFCYSIFDRYGHGSSFSRSYDKRADALAELEDELKRCAKSPGAPFTGILWPAVVKVRGQKFQLKNEKVVSTTR